MKKNATSYWSDCGTVYFTDGEAFGVTPDLQTVWLGKGESVQKCLDERQVINGIQGINQEHKSVIDGIINYRAMEGIGNDRLSKRCVERSSDGLTTRDNKQTITTLNQKQRLSSRISSARAKSISGRSGDDVLEKAS